MKGSGRLQRENIDYRVYRPAFRERFLTLGLGLGLGAAVCWLCYNSLYAAPAAIPVMIIFYRVRIRSLAERRKQTLLYHFKDFVTALHAALRAGYSVENGVASAAKDVELLYGEKDTLTRELKNISARLRMRIRVEDLFSDLGERADLEDIRTFAELLAVGKKTGGNMSRLLQQTSHILCDKIDTRQEIDAQIAAKAFEQKIMSIMPAGIILYMRLSFSGFIEVLYGDLAGCVIMTICLAVYAAALFWGRKIVRIEVI